MAKLLFLQVDPKTRLTPASARIVLGDHSCDPDHDDHYLSAECVSVGEVQEAVAYIKGLLDGILTEAKRKLG